MSTAQQEILSDSIVMSRKQYEHLQDQLKECAFMVKYLKRMVEPARNTEWNCAYIFFDEADLSVVEQADNKLKEKA